MRVSGVLATPLFRDGIGNSVLPDTLIQDRFVRDTVEVGTPLAPDLTVALGMALSETTELELAAGYTFGRLDVTQGGASQSAGTLAIGHAALLLRKPVRGFHVRGGIGAMWFHGDDFTAVREMRGINPLIEAAVTRRWRVGGFGVDAGLVGQAAQVSSEAVQVRQGPAGMYYRLGVEVGLKKELGR